MVGTPIPAKLCIVWPLIAIAVGPVDLWRLIWATGSDVVSLGANPFVPVGPIYQDYANPPVGPTATHSFLSSVSCKCFRM